MKNFILNLWNKLSDENKVRVISAGNTFASVFVLTFATSLIVSGHVEWSIVFWGGVFSAALREAIKAVVALVVPVRLGGKKK
jgi:hypothetical protein